MLASKGASVRIVDLKIIGLTPGRQPMRAGGLESVVRRNLTE
jgi:hypothetical protein